MKNTKRFLAIILALMMVISIIPMSSITASATQSVAGSYNFDYNVITGSGANDIVAVAQANIGRTTSSLGYTEHWCADFVSDCARLVGVENIIPFNGGVPNLRNAILNAGGTIVSTRKKGDIVFYYCNYCQSWCHVGIVVDGVYSIEGNINGQVYYYNGSYIDGDGHSIGNGITKQYIRPNYPNGPVGKVELVDGSGNAIRIKGWAYDPDVPTESIDIHVYVNNEIYMFNANEYRKDIGDAIYGIGNYHGFDVTMPTLASGTYSVRVLLVNNTWNYGNKSPFIYTNTVQVTHSHKYTSEITTTATHTTTGVITYTCVCGVSYTEAIEKIVEHSYDEIVVSPTCTEKGYTTYICECGDSYIENITLSNGHNFQNGVCVNCGEIEPTVPSNPNTPDTNYTFAIQEPSRTSIRNKDGIILHTDVQENTPAGSYVEWSWNNSNFDVEKNNDGTLTIISENNGKTTFTATLYDVDGSILATETIEMTSKAGFFDKIGGFFRSLFGSTKIYDA